MDSRRCPRLTATCCIFGQHRQSRISPDILKVMADTNMSEAAPTAENTGESNATPKRGKPSREFLLIVGLVFLLAAGALGFQGWQNLQMEPDLKFAKEFIETNMAPTAQPHLDRPAMNGQVAAFYKENGHVESIVWQRLDRREVNPFGEPTCITETKVNTKNGPVLITIKAKMHQGQRSIVSMVYRPES